MAKYEIIDSKARYKPFEIWKDGEYLAKDDGGGVYETLEEAKGALRLLARRTRMPRMEVVHTEEF